MSSAVKFDLIYYLGGRIAFGDVLSVLDSLIKNYGNFFITEKIFQSFDL